MRFGLFYEHQLPRPFDEDSDRRLLSEALEQIELADRLGIDYVWEVEHHFLEEYSHSSAPEVFLAAASQRTQNIRLGHGIVQAIPGINHPVRIAERIATLDLLSNGRVELGTGQGSSAAELGGFLVDRDSKHRQWEDALDAITRMFVETPFAGWDSRFWHMPPRNVVPKPMQKPHPPLWVACSRRETIHVAARKGLGALSFSFAEPEHAAKWVDEYYRLLTSDACVPAGYAVHPNVAVVVPMMCHDSEQTAIEWGIDGANFFGYSLAHYYGLRPHRPGVTNIWEEFQERRREAGYAREAVRADKKRLGVRSLQQGLGSLRGAIGTPAQVTELLQRYQRAGVDQVIFVMQSGNNRHEHIVHSLELFAREVMPRFVEGREQAEAAKAERLAPALARALERRAPPRLVDGYRIDEAGELERARERQRRELSLSRRLRKLPRQARRQVRDRVQKTLASFVRDKSEAQLERHFSRPMIQSVLFGAMARSFQPEKSLGFQGDISYHLDAGANGHRQSDRWTLRIQGQKARAMRRGSDHPSVTIRMSVADFARVVTGQANPAQLMFDGRVQISGDFSVALRVREMFGAPSLY